MSGSTTLAAMSCSQSPKAPRTLCSRRLVLSKEMTTNLTGGTVSISRKSENNSTLRSDYALTRILKTQALRAHTPSSTNIQDNRTIDKKRTVELAKVSESHMEAQKVQEDQAAIEEDRAILSWTRKSLSEER